MLLYYRRIWRYYRLSQYTEYNGITDEQSVIREKLAEVECCNSFLTDEVLLGQKPTYPTSEFRHILETLLHHFSKRGCSILPRT